MRKTTEAPEAPESPEAGSHSLDHLPFSCITGVKCGCARIAGCSVEFATSSAAEAKHGALTLALNGPDVCKVDRKTCAKKKSRQNGDFF